MSHHRSNAVLKSLSRSRYLIVHQRASIEDIFVMCSLNVTNVLDESGWNVFLMVLRKSFIWDWLITRSARNAVQSVHGHTLKRAPHQRMLLQDLVETVRAQRVKTAVGLSPHAGCASSLCQQANL